MNEYFSYWKSMHFLVRIAQNWSQDRLKMVKIALSECKSVISNLLQKQLECKIGLFLGKIRSFFEELTERIDSLF